MRFTFIRDHACRWPIRLMRRVLQVCQPAVTMHGGIALTAPGLVANRHLLGDVERLQAEHRGRYGLAVGCTPRFVLKAERLAGDASPV